LLPLQDIRVLDFSTLLPGPLASLILAEAGAEVIKVERPGTGEDMRGYPPISTGSGTSRPEPQQRALALDLRAPGSGRSSRLRPRSTSSSSSSAALDRLGYGLARGQPKIIYCAILQRQDGPGPGAGTA
jgi:crotonobetainyl-CoA:carnitine CoA-transferase CaiB-like acyl-CoA transferase